MSGTEDAGREVRDCYGRLYFLRHSAADRVGRESSPWLTWPPMAAVGLLQYGFGAIAPALMAARGWSLTTVFSLLAVWVVCQAGVGFPVAFLRERRGLGPRAVMLLAAVLSAAGPLALAHSSGYAGALIGYSILGGAGAGFVYGTCTSTLTKWYPERSNGKVSAITGVFAYASAPFAAAAVLRLDAAWLTMALDAAAILILLVIAGFGAFFRDPPARWWPADVDPRAWALSTGPGRRANAPAVRQFSAAQALRTGALPVMYLIGIGAGAVSLLDAAFLVVFMADLGAATSVIAVTVALLLGLNGLGRAASIRISDRWGRRRTLKYVLMVQTLGQLLLAMAAMSGSTGMLVVASAVAGCGGGAFYPLVASLVRDYFGHQNALEVHALVYSAKAFAGVLGVGVTAFAMTWWTYPSLFLVAGCVSLTAVVGIASLQRPGLPATLPSHGAGRLAG
ncbi:MFS transporter [Pseudonocardia spinosispora]|uniref:MFS transporter n=1 Tax=Pseudonocardia spinosispora TaxID=103441 RepID=UPI000419E220|nr:MFS transporter [Pseudonocardia spinosispora]